MTDRNVKGANAMPQKKTYAEMLRHPRWQSRRLEVMSRDGFRCTACADEDGQPL